MRFVEIVEPELGNTFEIRFENTLNSLLKENKDKHIVKLEVFVNNAHLKDFLENQDFIKDSLKTIFKDRTPAFTIVYLPICSGSEFTIQYQMYDGDVEIEYKSLLDHSYVIAKSEKGIELFSGGISFNETSLMLSAQRGLDLSEQILMAEAMHFGDIYRQWNYIPNAPQSTSQRSDNKDGLTIFEEIRSLYYDEELFINGQPLNNNIPHFSHNLLIDFMAFSTYADDSIETYDSSWLNAHNNLKTRIVFDGKQELWFSNLPLLSDAYAEQNNDIEKQTIHILKNIAKLLETSKLNFNKDAKLCFIKVNIKPGEDYKKVEKHIKLSLPEVPNLLVGSNTTNSGMLVEIEGWIG